MSRTSSIPFSVSSALWEREYYPWLLYNNGGQRQDQTFCGFSSSDKLCSSESKYIAELSNKKVMYCSIDGRWLLLLRAATDEKEGKLSIWNPMTLESIALPTVRVGEDDGYEYIDKGQALFSSSPNDPNCLVFLFLGVIPLLLYCRVGDQNWREFNYAQTIQAQKPSIPHIHQCCVLQRYNLDHGVHRCTQLLHQPVSFNGKIYALSSCSLDLVRIDVHECKDCSLSVLISKFQGPNRVTRFPRHGSALRTFLVSWGDECINQVSIFLTDSPDLKSREAPRIVVREFDFSTNSWLPRESLDQGLIFLGTRYSFACTWGSTYPNKWSAIYFTSDYNHRILFSYRVEDGTITSYSPIPTADLPKEPPQWIMPFEEVEQWVHGKELYAGNTIVDCSKKQRLMVEEHESASQGQSSFSDLTSELLGLIAEKHLYSFVTYIHFPFINKSCATSRIGITRKNPFHPCLIYTDKVNDVYHITDSNLTHKLSIKIPEVLQGKRISCSRDGWLLLKGYGSYSSYDVDCLFNPFTKQIVETTGNKFQKTCKYGISSITILGNPSPSSPENCSVLAMSLLSSRRASWLQPGHPATEGKAEWWTFVTGFSGQAIEFIPSCNSPVLWKDCWYYLGHNGRLGLLRLIDIKARRFEWKVEAHKCPCENYTRSYLSECGGELVSVFISDYDQESWIRVFKLGDKEWEEIDSLRSYTLYLGWPSSMSCPAETPDMADRIYFPRFYKDGLVYYSLKTRKYHSIGKYRNDELKSFHGTTMYSDCAWIKPQIVG